MEAHLRAQDVFLEALKGAAGKRARDYLERREIGHAIRERFGIGYAPADGSLLGRRLREQGFREELLARAGLLVPGEGGGSTARKLGS